MKKLILMIAAIVSFSVAGNNLFAQTQQTDTSKKPVATAAADTAAKDVVATLANVAEETTLTAAIKAANLESDLKGPGPFTVLAPNNDAFNTLSKTKLDSLMKNPAALATVLKAHVLSGKFIKADLIKALVAGKGTASLKTIDGQTLTLSVKNKKLAITDAQGTVVQVTSFDTPCTNGVIHGINGVLMAK